MRINIILDDKLMAEAFQYAAVSTAQELVSLALREFVINHRRRGDIRKLRGKNVIRPDYDYKALRNGEGK